MKFIFPCLGSSTKNDNEPKEVEEVTPKTGNQRLQFIAAISACISGIGLGASETWTSPALPYLISEKSEFPVTVIQGSWIAALFNVGGTVGYLIFPLLVDRIGRKYSLLIFALPQVVGWTIAILANSYQMLYVSRIINGLGYCASLGILIMYLGEIADKDIRGILLSLIKISYDVGILFVILAGAFLSYNAMNLLLLSLPLLFVVTFLFMPESPYFYLLRGQDEKAIKNIMKLQGVKDSERGKLEIERIQKTANDGQGPKENGLWRLVTQKRYRKALAISICSELTKICSGYFAILAYTQTIFSYSEISLEPKYATVIMAVVKIIFGLFASRLIERVGRRIPVLLSGIFASLSLAIVGAYFFLKHLEVEYLASISWLPLLGLTSFEVACAFGISPITFVLLGELFPTDVKGPATALVTVVAEFFLFLITLGFETLNAAAGIYSTFWIYATCCLVGTLTLFVIMPETKGKTLEEIQEFLESKKKPTGNNADK